MKILSRTVAAVAAVAAAIPLIAEANLHGKPILRENHIVFTNLANISQCDVLSHTITDGQPYKGVACGSKDIPVEKNPYIFIWAGRKHSKAPLDAFLSSNLTSDQMIGFEDFDEQLNFYVKLNITFVNNDGGRYNGVLHIGQASGYESKDNHFWIGSSTGSTEAGKNNCLNLGFHGGSAGISLKQNRKDKSKAISDYTFHKNGC